MVIDSKLLDTLQKINDIKEATGWKTWRIYYAGNVDYISYLYIPVEPYQKLREFEHTLKDDVIAVEEVRKINKEIKQISDQLTKYKFVVPMTEDDYRVINNCANNMVIELTMLK